MKETFYIYNYTNFGLSFSGVTENSDNFDQILETWNEYVKANLISEEIFNNIGGIEVSFENNLVVRVLNYFVIKDEFHFEESSEELKIEGLLKEMKKPVTSSQIILNAIYNKKGLHKLGGVKPNSLNYPKIPNSIIHYIAKISNLDPYFSWLPFNLDIIWIEEPSYSENLYIDYSDNENPKILNNPDDIFYNYGNLEIIENEISYLESPISFEQGNNFNFELAHAGLPCLQNLIYEIPKCPKTGKTMKFISGFWGGQKRSNSNSNEIMNFYGDSVLYVFFETSSKIACYFLQGS